MKLTENNIIQQIHNSKSLSGIVKSINNNHNLYNYINKYVNINSNNIYEKIYYIKHNLTNSDCICSICNKNNKIFDNKYKKYRNWCSNICKNKYKKINIDIDKENERINKIKKTKLNYSKEKKQEIIDKIKQTNINKYGVDSYAKTQEFKNYMLNEYGYVSPFELKETHDKSKLTLLEKYNVDHNFKINGIQDKITNTFLSKYNTNRPAQNDIIKTKIITTNNKKYGGNSPMCNKNIQIKAKNTHLKNFEFYGLSNPETLKKYKQTMFNRYGYECIFHNEEFLFKILLKCKKYKIYKMPSGKEVFVQGYEDYVIDHLLLNYNEDDIIISNKDITNNVGVIFYEYNGNKHKYYPDIYIKSINKIIEVKSIYTYNKDLEINLLKQNACINKNINFEFNIINKKEYNNWKKHKQNNN